jgi:carbamoyltransferase
MVDDACGRPYSRESISLAIQNSGRRVRWVESSDTIADAVDLLCDGKMIGWFDGRSEIGPARWGKEASSVIRGAPRTGRY